MNNECDVQFPRKPGSSLSCLRSERVRRVPLCRRVSSSLFLSFAKNGGRDVFRNFRREIFRLYIYLSFRDNENSNDSGANADERRVNNPLPPNFSIKIDLTQINSLKLSRDCGKF